MSSVGIRVERMSVVEGDSAGEGEGKEEGSCCCG